MRQNRQNQTNYPYQKNSELNFHTRRNQKNTKLVVFWVRLKVKFKISKVLMVFHCGA